MNSSTTRYESKQLSQLEIKRQIALLQSRLEPEEPAATRPKSPKRKAAPVVLAPATPSPKKKRRLEVPPDGPIAQPKFPGLAKPKQPASASVKPRFVDPAPSNFISKLSDLARRDEEEEESEPIPRSTAFQQKATEHVLPPASAVTRDDRLAIIEELEPGPYEHKAPVDDPRFQRLEPHSGIRLASRTLPHEELSEYMRGRFYISPSRLYSCARLSADKRGYDVPVAGDWVTIAVVAERGPIRMTKAPVTVEREDDDEVGPSTRKRNPPPDERPNGKKFVTLKLIDFGSRSRSSTSATGGTSVIRGDAFLNLLLFESDVCERVQHEGRKPEVTYRGGSRGAFENMFNVKEGDVIALLNPRILKPYQRANDAPHHSTNIFGLTPESAASIVVLGRSLDLGMCSVRKKDGKVCGSWCDKRLSDVCEFHVQAAVQQRRASRPEFSASTGTLTNTAKHKAKHAYDPAKLWGLQPEERKNSTYVISGHVVSGSSNDPRTLHATENIGREGQAKAKRKLNRDADQQLKNLLERDKNGMQAVICARQAAKKMALEQSQRSLSKQAKGKQKEEPKKSKEADSDSDRDGLDMGQDSDDDLVVEEEPKKAKGYTASVIKSLGFDPTLRGGPKKVDNLKLQAKLRELESVRTARTSIQLTSRPGPKIRSGVRAPEKEEKMVDLDDL